MKRVFMLTALLVTGCAGSSVSPLPAPAPTPVPVADYNTSKAQVEGAYCATINPLPSFMIATVWIGTDAIRAVPMTSGIVNIINEGTNVWGVAGENIGTTSVWIVDDAKQTVLQIYPVNVQAHC